MTRRHRLAAVMITTAASWLCLGTAAWAHSPTDFLKVPVGQRATVLLPPMTTLPGRMEVAISAPSGYRIAAVSAGAGWQSRVAPEAAVVEGRGGAGRSLLVTVTGTASQPGVYPLVVRVLSTSAPTEVFRWNLTALAGYARPIASDVGSSRPDAPVATTASHAPRLWPVSAAFALAALAVLLVKRSSGPGPVQQ